jgi:hypothetical protein
MSMDAIFDAIPTKVSAEMNEALNRDYTNDEIKKALFQMGPTKATGSDGFPALFYQNHWDLLEEDIYVLQSKDFSWALIFQMALATS